MKTAQQIFDITLNHLRQQKVASYIDDSYFEEDGEEDWQEREFFCAYRGHSGTSCAVGCHIPDEVYEELIITEGESIKSQVPSMVRLREMLSLEPHVELLSEMQKAHDTNMPKNHGFSMLQWESEMQKIAEKFNLNYETAS